MELKRRIAQKRAIELKKRSRIIKKPRKYPDRLPAVEPDSKATGENQGVFWGHRRRVAQLALAIEKPHFDQRRPEGIDQFNRPGNFGN